MLVSVLDPGADTSSGGLHVFVHAAADHLVGQVADLPVGKTLLHQLGNLQFLAGELRGRCSRVPPSGRVA
jgi:hypothetical protein